MAATSRRAGPALIEKLFQEPYRFDYFQAVRILERYYLELGKDDPAWQRNPIGHDFSPKSEVVRLRAMPAQSFPAGAISSIRGAAGAATPPDASGMPAEMVIACLGLTGPNGVLPRHYTTLLLTRIKDKDVALRDFLDLFNHRVASLFYRAWEKYRFPIAYERSKLDGNSQKEDLFTSGLYCLVGMGTSGIRGRQTVDDETYLYYAGHFAHFPRAAINLECMLQDYFQLPVQVEQFQGQWLYLHVEDCSRLPGLGLPLGRHNQLGVNLVIGSRVWDVQSKIRIRVGPLKYADFRRFMPTGDALRPMCHLTRTFIGPEFDFDVQPVLLGSEVPWCQLSPHDSQGARLGWNTWVRAKPFTSTVTDAIFSLADV